MTGASISENTFGTCYTPMTTRNYQRVGARERLMEVRERYPDRLTIELNALATRVLFDEQRRAAGVEYLKGERLYQAHAKPSDAAGETRQARARREVILAGGVFNSPQLLMLSGIGPEAELRRHAIPPVALLERVGKNLQDRYEVAVVNRMEQPWDMLRGATFTDKDPQYEQWQSTRRGIYTTNGIPLCVIARSTGTQPSPDLFCYALLADFRGYRPGYSEDVRRHPNYLTWVVLKGHTNNTAGEVTLASRDPRARPQINFKYFEEGTDASGDDLTAVVEGVSLVRRMTAGLGRALGMVEEMPGPGYESEDSLRDFVRTHAWGHHASCTLSDRAARSGRRLERRLQGVRSGRPARCRCIGVSTRAGAVHRERRLHDWGKGRGRDHRGREADLTEPAKECAYEHEDDVGDG